VFDYPRGKLTLAYFPNFMLMKSIFVSKNASNKHSSLWPVL
jgi:hypothetical protein